MIDTGMNRLGSGRPKSTRGRAHIDTLQSHLACADEDSSMNGMQLERFRAVAAAPRARLSLANRAGICLGRDYSFDLVRPGMRCTAGSARRGRGQYPPGRAGEAQVVQRRTTRRRDLRLWRDLHRS